MGRQDLTASIGRRFTTEDRSFLNDSGKPNEYFLSASKEDKDLLANPLSIPHTVLCSMDQDHSSNQGVAFVAQVGGTNRRLKFGDLHRDDVSSGAVVKMSTHKSPRGSNIGDEKYEFYTLLRLMQAVSEQASSASKLVCNLIWAGPNIAKEMLKANKDEEVTKEDESSWRATNAPIEGYSVDGNDKPVNIALMLRGILPQNFDLHVLNSDFNEVTFKGTGGAEKGGKATKQKDFYLRIDNDTKYSAINAASSKQLKDGANVFHTIGGTGANVGIGENYNSNAKSFEKFDNTEWGHHKFNDLVDKEFLQDFQSRWEFSDEDMTELSFEDFFAGGSQPLKKYLERLKGRDADPKLDDISLMNKARTENDEAISIVVAYAKDLAKVQALSFPEEMKKADLLSFSGSHLFDLLSIDKAAEAYLEQLKVDSAVKPSVAISSANPDFDGAWHLAHEAKSLAQ